MLNTLQSWYDGLDKEIKKIVFFLGSGVLLAGIVIGLFWINTLPSQRSNTRSNTTLNNSIIETPDQDAVSFEDAGGIEKVDTDKVGFDGEIMFLSGKQVAFLDKDLKLRVNGRSIVKSSSFVPVSMYSQGSSIFINEMNRSTIFENGLFQTIDSSITSIVPMSSIDSEGVITDSYLFLKNNQQGLTLNQSSTLEFNSQSVKNLGIISPSITYEIAEIRDISGIPSVIVYEKSSKQGQIEIWIPGENSTMQKVQLITRVRSVKYGYQKMMLTRTTDNPTNSSLYENIVITFNNQKQPEYKKIDLTEVLNEQNIYGSVVAQRCGFDTQNIVYCLVKADKVSQYDSTKPDVLAKIDLTRSQLSIVNPNIKFVADSVHVGPDKAVYVVTQDTSLLYKFV